MKLASTEEKLKERIKELTCLYEISKIISNADSLNSKFLKEILLCIKKAWQFNDDAIIEIQILDFHLSTSDIVEPTVYQTSLIRITNNNIGFIKVHYPLNKYNENHFLEDEQNLLHTIANDLGVFTEKQQILERSFLLNSIIERMDRLNTLGEMTAGIAHELNTPLGNILGFAELIKSQTTDPEITSDILIVINTAIYCREIVKKMMFFSLETPIELKQQEFKPIMNFVLSFLKSNFLKKNIKIELQFTENTLIANIDSVQITQVLFNLLLNALYASPEKSIITIVAEKDNTNLIITIKDQGTGIPDAIKQKIFDPFFTTKSTSEGSGLGLSVVQGIIKNHNGEIKVTDNLPAGSVFTIKLPIY